MKKMIMSALEPILSRRELAVVQKRLQNKHLTQTESNYLSRSIRPKLEAGAYAADTDMLARLAYRRKKYERNDSLIREELVAVLRDHLRNLKAIMLFGSYIRNNHTNYRDIDIMVIVKEKIWKTSAERFHLEKAMEKALSFNGDITLITVKGLQERFPYSPLLQTQLEDYIVLYGKVALPEKIIIEKSYLYARLLALEPICELGKSIKPKYLYNAIRTCLAIELFVKKEINNRLIIKTIEEHIGKETANCLLRGTARPVQQEIALSYLKHLYKRLERTLA